MGSREEREQERRDLAKISGRKRAERDAAIQKRLDEQAAAETAQRERDSKMDGAFLAEAYDVLGFELDEIEEYARKHADDLIDATEAQRVIAQARRQAKGGWFTKGNSRKAVKTLKSSKAVRNAAEQAKKKNGCFLFTALAGLALAGVAWVATWGAVELVSALGI